MAAAHTDPAQVQSDVVAALRRAAFLLERGGATPLPRRRLPCGRPHPRCPRPHRSAHPARRRLPDRPARRRRTHRRDRHGGGHRRSLALPGRLGGPLPRHGRHRRGRGPAPALRGDLHAHTDQSDGSTPVQEMALAALDLGHEYLAITDHSPRLTVANGLSPARLRAQLDHIEALNRSIAPFRVLTGIEVDILDDGSLDQEPELLDRLDVVVASLHSQLRMDAPTMTRRMRAAVANPLVDVLGHCTGRQLTGTRKRPPSEFDPEAVFADCAEHGVAVEVNCRPDRLDPPHALLDVAVAAGCRFTIDTDAHAPGQLDWQPVGCDRAAAHGIGPDRVLDAWPLDRLLAHLDGRRVAAQ